MEVDCQWAGKENTMYGYEQLDNLSESKSELKKKRDQLKMEMCYFHKLEYFAELQGEQNERKAEFQAACKKIQERRPLGI